MAATFKLNTREFDKTLRQYAALANKDAALICNTKAFFIARGASRQTFRPSKEQIRKDLEDIAKVAKTGKTGKVRKSWAKTAEGAPIVALLINWKRGKLGKPGLFGEAMKLAIKGFIKKRQQARAYMASGWNPAIKAFELLAEKRGKVPPRDAEASKQKGRGAYVVARAGLRPVAKLINMAFAKQTTTKDPDLKVAMPALQRAINDERASMLVYIEDKLRRSAKSLGIRTN